MYREESAQLIEYKTFCRDNSRWNKKSSTAEKAVLLLLKKRAGMGAEGTHAGPPVKCNPAVPDIKIQTFVRLYGRLRIVYNKIYRNDASLHKLHDSFAVTAHPLRTLCLAR